jgi:hypothetical protein
LAQFTQQRKNTFFRGRFLNQFQNLNSASSKLEVNKVNPIKFSTSYRFKTRLLQDGKRRKTCFRTRKTPFRART